MIGHITATIHPIDLDAALFELRFIPQQVGRLTPATEGEGVRVFKQEQSGRNLTSGDLVRQAGPANPRLAGRGPNPDSGRGIPACGKYNIVNTYAHSVET